MIVSKRVQENISSGRKVFKFLKFVDEMKSIVDLLKDDNGKKHGVLVYFLTLLARICGFFYYILDNVVWFTNMGMLRYYILCITVIIAKRHLTR